LAKYWVHCDRVLVDGKKPSDKGTSLNLSDLIQMGYSGRVVRYWLLSNHYRKPLSYSKAHLEDARRSVKRLDHCIYLLQKVNIGQACAELDQLLYDLKHGFINAMDDDLNISAAMASLFKMVKKINGLVREMKIDPQDASKIVDGFRNINSVLNIMDFADAVSDPQLTRLINKRKKARAEKNWELADNIREQLREKGIIVQDRKVS
jgi:cysteinyl-tRNA synthetase